MAESVTCVGWVIYHWSEFDTRNKIYPTYESAYAARKKSIALRVAALGSDGRLYTDGSCESWIAGIGGVSCGAAKHTGTLGW